METIAAKGKGLDDLRFRIQVAVEDCTGCDNCVAVCPTKTKSLQMQPIESQEVEKHHWQYLFDAVTNKEARFDPCANVKLSQLAQPLFEFSGACAGCGETPYIKLVTQLFGENMIIANATGCSSIYGASAPSTPYTVNKSSGCGPAWGNSLFEDNAEFGFGIAEGVQTQRDRLESIMRGALDQDSLSEPIANTFKEWIHAKADRPASHALGKRILELLEGRTEAWARDIQSLKSYLGKKSIWIFGGDGWAYDIGYGGLDHVLASGQDVNILVLDTEVYSNTGGQASKSTPLGALAKFASTGKQVRKKNLGLMAMAYGHAYVAQIAMGASQFQCLKAFREAESFAGPSIIIAYSPCIEHGIAHGMAQTQQAAKDAVNCGYWNLFRCDPRLEERGDKPFQLDSKAPKFDEFQAFLEGELRFKSLARNNPDQAKTLFKKARAEAERRHRIYQMQADFNPNA
jgi:pyruvate-ferredoxin/flavodoxin oxidoreductase